MPTNPVTTAARTARAVAAAATAPARAVVRRVAARLDGQDAAARARGWTVEVRPAGGRVYRDPRFDRLTPTTVAAVLDDSQQAAAGQGTGR